VAVAEGRLGGRLRLLASGGLVLRTAPGVARQGRLRDERLEQQPAGGRVFQEGDDEVAVVIEGGGVESAA
jgi:hypothetical protein